MSSPSRRTFLKSGLVLGIPALGAAEAQAAARPTPAEIEGPFYPDHDFDLTRIEGKQGTAKGTVVWVKGQVVDTDENPVAETSVELWQANAAGRYNHPRDEGNDTPLDPCFQGWAIFRTGKDGNFRFKTVIPGSYAAGEGWIRPPHIHFKVSKLGYVELITQMYFPGERLNEADRLLKRHPAEAQALMIARRTAGKNGEPDTFEHRIVLQKA